MKEFLSLGSALTDRELQLALARLADLRVAEPESRVVQLKGQILTAYYTLRAEGLKAHSKAARTRWNAKSSVFVLAGFGLADRLLREVELFELPVLSGPLPQPEYWAEESFRQRVRLFAP